MTERIFVTPKKGITLTGHEVAYIRDDLCAEYLKAKKTVEDRWGISITMVDSDKQV